MINETVASQLEQELRDIADSLEEERCKIFQQETCEWEDDKGYVDDRLFSLQSQIRQIAELVGYMDFKKDCEK